jgi:methionyl aminopeptidase
MIPLKSPEELAIIRENALLVDDILQRLVRAARPGVSTAQLDREAERLIHAGGAEPAFKGYRGFPASICTSINEEIVHGIPREERVLREGDLLSIDIGLKRQGFYADKATTVAIGAETAATRELLAVAAEALRCGTAAAQVGARVSDISHAIGSLLQARGYQVVKRFVGHGIGRQMHEEPQIPNYGPPGRGARLRAGMVLCIEPMCWKARNETDEEERVGEDGWTVRTPRGEPAAHLEEMVWVSESGPQELTQKG